MRYDLKRMQVEATQVAKRSKATIPGYDMEDLAQEAMMVMWQAVATGGIQGRRTSKASAYLKCAGENRIRKLLRQSRAAKRCPLDAAGVPMMSVPLDELTVAYRMETDVNETTQAIPPCHVRGEDPEGYDPKDSLCHNCPDKFSCLRESIETGLTDAKLSDDNEVRTLVAAAGDSARLRIAHEVVTERQRRRIRLRTTKRPIPPELDVNAPLVLPPAPEPIPARQRRSGASMGAPAPDPAMTEPARMPGEKHLTPAQLDQALSRVRIGQPFPLEIGHVLVRRRSEWDVCVEIREDGFWLNLNGRTYGSLSTAAKAAELMYGASWGTNRPGNAYFNIVRCSNTEIRDSETGSVLACRRGVTT